MSHMGVLFTGISNASRLTEMIFSAQTLTMFRGKMKTIAIARYIEKPRYASLSYVNANFNLVMVSCDLVLWMLYLFNRPCGETWPFIIIVFMCVKWTFRKTLSNI